MRAYIGTARRRIFRAAYMMCVSSFFFVHSMGCGVVLAWGIVCVVLVVLVMPISTSYRQR